MIPVLLAAASLAIGLTAAGMLLYGGLRDWRRSRELRRLNADPSQHPIGV